ncbi:hypothetical protein A3B18_01850 [Candidatus Giovannonibacteria bacterium RIFCSPLOWO2_01_FULL_46_13]|uniref:Primosomal protein N n=1 Tax=Candidatus Giovannonibacteria bacterium RIFCSPLOWO2_01_FULL_46_13 TaxID=1798352 RepID=A0A1F5X2W2_9BACT|nr:MAG: hypothetical protein A3B18_01850 [Candidatus Giovannonibacteria bacterium RIFCSPLOWO2_01_FULL_46_13]
MKVLEVIPVTRSIYAPGTLSYFSTKNAARGDLVKINFRNKETFAVVWKTSDLAEEKAELKKIKSFKLKPISSVVKEKFLSEEWFKILEEISKNLFIPSSILLSSLIPKALLSKSLILSENQPAGRHQKSAFRGSKEERIQFFKGLIREHFARKKSLAIIVPRIDTLKNLENELGKGIENYVFSFSSELTSKKYLTAYNRTATEAHPVLILGTYQAIFFGRNDIETLIVDEEGSRLWKEREGFPFDMRKIFEIISEAKGLKLIWSDQILRVETIYKTEHGEIEPKNSLTGRIQSQIETKIIPLVKDENGFHWISKELRREIEEALFRNEKILLFANRKGYSSFTICQDCSHLEVCPSCSTPLILHGAGTGKRKFLCHHCLKSQEVPIVCSNCGSWKLKDFGLGIEKVKEEFAKIFPKAKNVAIETERIFSGPEQKFDLVAIISLDYLFSIPDFRINETIFRLISELKSKATKKIILQTRLSENKLLADAIAGNVSSFYQEEIKAREDFSYPPFTRLIKLSREDKNLSLLQAEEKKVMETLKGSNPISFPAFHERLKNRYRWNILLKLQPKKWPEENLRSLLEKLGPMWQISVDPDSII